MIAIQEFEDSQYCHALADAYRNLVNQKSTHHQHVDNQNHSSFLHHNHNHSSPSPPSLSSALCALLLTTNTPTEKNRFINSCQADLQQQLMSDVPLRTLCFIKPLSGAFEVCQRIFDPAAASVGVEKEEKNGGDGEKGSSSNSVSATEKAGGAVNNPWADLAATAINTTIGRSLTQSIKPHSTSSSNDDEDDDNQHTPSIDITTICTQIWQAHQDHYCLTSVWSEWTDCSAHCDGGIQSRRRMILREGIKGGCGAVDLQDSRRCNTQGCGERVKKDRNDDDYPAPPIPLVGRSGGAMWIRWVRFQGVNRLSVVVTEDGKDSIGKGNDGILHLIHLQCLIKTSPA